jgi:hypothetical protein
MRALMRVKVERDALLKQLAEKQPAEQVQP